MLLAPAKNCGVTMVTRATGGLKADVFDGTRKFSVAGNSHVNKRTPRGAADKKAPDYFIPTTPTAPYWQQEITCFWQHAKSIYVPCLDLQNKTYTVNPSGS